MLLHRNVAIAVVAIAAVMIAFFAFPRYDLRPSAGTIAFRIDRWTGEVSVVQARPDGQGPWRATVRPAIEGEDYETLARQYGGQPTTP
jgi:hypothetical protein